MTAPPPHPRDVLEEAAKARAEARAAKATYERYRLATAEQRNGYEVGYYDALIANPPIAEPREVATDALEQKDAALEAAAYGLRMASGAMFNYGEDADGQHYRRLAEQCDAARAEQCEAARARKPDALDRPAILAAARAWWAQNMPDSNLTNVIIGGDGRVKAHWRDADEDGTYTLPVTFAQDVAARASQPAEVDPVRVSVAGEVAGDRREQIIAALRNRLGSIWSQNVIEYAADAILALPAADDAGWRETARESFYAMIADAGRFDEDVDGDCDSDGRPTMTIDYHLTVGGGQLEELCDALGVPGGQFGETVGDRINRALAAPPALTPQESGT